MILGGDGSYHNTNYLKERCDGRIIVITPHQAFTKGILIRGVNNKMREEIIFDVYLLVEE